LPRAPLPKNHERDAAAKLANLYAREAAVAERERQLDVRVAAIRAKATDEFRARDDSAADMQTEGKRGAKRFAKGGAIKWPMHVNVDLSKHVHVHAAAPRNDCWRSDGRRADGGRSATARCDAAAGDRQRA
jgi:hypothetical protein